MLRARRIETKCAFLPGGVADQFDDPAHRLCRVVEFLRGRSKNYFRFTTLSYAACNRSPTDGPRFRLTAPRWVSRNSSMNSAHIFVPPSLNSRARMPSSSLTGRYL